VKRFWKEVTVQFAAGGFGIALDGRPVKTPARAELVVKSEPLADAIANEWRTCGEEVDPRAMPLTGLANAAIDRISPDPQAFAKGLIDYTAGDLLCYRAEGPPALVERQNLLWNPLLEWAQRRFDVDFVRTDGIMHVDQPAATVDRLSHEVLVQGPFRLAGLSPMVTIGGSLVSALAVLDDAVSPTSAWEAVSVDDRWQIEQWGADSEAVASLDYRERDFLVAARFLSLL
jgi:chaperone required for assembly of F1-ATPase